MSKVSIIVPVYNAEKYILKCLESIKNQSMKDFECLIIDDGSKDNSIKIAEEFIKGDERFKIYHKENGGQSSARNLGIKKSNGEYICFIDSDDVITREYLAKLIDNTGNSDISICSYKFIKSQNIEEIGNTGGSISYHDRKEFLRIFLYRNVKFVITTMLFNRNFILNNNLFFNEQIKFSEDQMYIWNCLFSASRISYDATDLYGYYLRSNSIMTGTKFITIYNTTDTYKENCEKLAEEYPEENDIIKYIYPRWSLGTLYTCAKLAKYEEFALLYNKLNASEIRLKLKGFNDVKARTLSYLLAFSKKISYLALRKI